MILKNSFYYYKNALTPEQCKSIIELGNSKILEEATTLGDDEKGKNPNKPSIGDKFVSEVNDKSKYHLRNSKVSWISEQWVSDLIMPYILKANYLAGWIFDINSHESFQFTKYQEKGAFYGWHTDGGGDWADVYKKEIPGVTPKDKKYVQNINQVGKVRKISMTIYLSDPNEYEGGDLCLFRDGEVKIQNFNPGSAVIFPSFTNHKVNKITSGSRATLAIWMEGPKFR